MKKFTARTIRTNLVLLVLLVLIPLCAILLYSSYEQKKQAINYAKQNAIRITRNLALQQKFIEENTFQVLSIISEIPEITQGETGKISTLLSSLIKKNPSYASLLLTNNKGDMIASATSNTKLNVSDRKYFKDVMKTKAFSVGEYAVGRLSNKRVIHYAYPILSHDSIIQYIIIASFDLKFYDTIFTSSNLGKDAIFTFIDPSGTIIYNSPNSKAKAGIKEHEKLLKFLHSGKTEDTFITRGSDSIERLYGYSTLKLPNQEAYMAIFVGVPLKVAIADFFKTLTKYALFWVLAGLLIILAAYLFAAKAIVKPIDKLVAVAGLIANGNLNAKIKIKNPSSELGKLGSAIEEMTFKLQQRETERNMALKDLKKLKERSDLAINAAKIGIWDWHIRNNKLIWDKNMFALYNVDSEAFNNQIENWYEFIHPSDIESFNNLLLDAIDKVQPFRSEFRIKLPNKTIKDIRIFGDIILDKESKPVRLIGVNWDITERKALERKLNEAKEKAETSDKLKSSFLANISHEIRTPLHGIIGFAQILKNDDISSQEKSQYLDIIVNSGNKLQSIISNIIDISLIDANQLDLIKKETDITSLLNDIYSFFINQKIEENKPFNFILEDIPQSPCFIQIDEFRIKQIFVNLLDNAFKFTENGEIRFGCKIESDLMVCYVKDTGIGIKKENIQSIFNSFKQIDEGYNRNYSGNGLGLAICKGLIELMGGKIWIERKTKGTDFIFTIPINCFDKNEYLINSGKSGILLN
jgi:signal transduction histidine kinase/HAMP domain-containing protein